MIDLRNLKTNSIIPEYVDYMPSELEEGKLYISEKFKLAIHLCACGCKVKTVTPLGNGEWNLTQNNDKVSLSPSIGNFTGENPYHAHYFITDNQIVWCY